MSDETVPRRRFLKGAGAAGTAVAATLAGAGPAPAAEQPTAAPSAGATSAAAPPPVDTFLILNPTEIAFLEAAADTLIPADELSPSGTACGCVVFIDRQLASAWGGGAKMYRSGPFAQGKPEQGYQFPLSPREYFLAGIAAANVWLRKTYGRELDRLGPAARVAALTAMEQGQAEFVNLDGRAFFGMLLTMTLDGFFADPIYGGNRDKASWRMVGFPGLPAAYAHLVDEFRDKRYTAPPRSIADF
jgi:gluconate 2-dehydrogenase gamma chain